MRLLRSRYIAEHAWWICIVCVAYPVLVRLECRGGGDMRSGPRVEVVDQCPWVVVGRGGSALGSGG